MACLLAALAAGAAASSARAVTIAYFSHGITSAGHPYGITAGPDGNLWFTEATGNRIGRITPSGVVTEFSAGISANSIPTAIAAGPDGNLWFTELGVNRIGRITPSGTVSEFPAGVSTQSSPGDVTVFGSPSAISAGPDGNVWFTEQGGKRVGRITPSGVVTEFSAGITESTRAIAQGPDENLWFTEGDGVARITPSGKVTEYLRRLTGGAPYGIAIGADGNMWVTESFPPGPAQIARITPSGHVREFPGSLDPKSGLRGITAGPDGNLWYAEYAGDVGIAGDMVGRITRSGVITEFAARNPYGITAGPADTVWFTAFDGGAIGRITITAEVGLVGKTANVKPGGHTTLELSCSQGRGRCAGTLTLTVRIAVPSGHSHTRRWRTVKLAPSVRFSIAAGRRAAVKLTLNRNGRTLLAHARHKRLSTQLRAATGAGGAHSTIVLIARG